MDQFKQMRRKVNKTFDCGQFISLPPTTTHSKHTEEQCLETRLLLFPCDSGYLFVRREMVKRPHSTTLLLFPVQLSAHTGMQKSLLAQVVSCTNMRGPLTHRRRISIYRCLKTWRATISPLYCQRLKRCHFSFPVSRYRPTL